MFVLCLLAPKTTQNSLTQKKKRLLLKVIFQIIRLLHCHSKFPLRPVPFGSRPSRKEYAV
jgi:hypothetical protein